MQNCTQGGVNIRDVGNGPWS